VHSSAAPRRRRQERDALSLGDLGGHVGYFVRRLQMWIFQDFIRTLASVDIRPAQYSVLALVEANPGRSQADIGETLGIERARLVHLLDELERRGLICRVPSTRDRRSYTLFLTDGGATTFAGVKALADRHEARAARKLGVAQHKALLALLRDVHWRD
jgi:DNA-binding MarR family transcriptional regulator